MQTSAEDIEALVDTSVAVALLVADHEHHKATLDAVGSRRLGLAGHSAFETFSVLSRLPPPARRLPAEVGRLLLENFPDSRYLSPEEAANLLGRLGRLGIGGGSVYDALVGAAAAEHALRLFTRDRRAAAIYRALEVEFELLA
jgi:predicted nucleic acid-binding protein